LQKNASQKQHGPRAAFSAGRIVSDLPRVLFYSDAPDYGGHEAMTSEAASYLCGRNEHAVSFAYYQGNSRLSERLDKIGGTSRSLTPIPIPFRSKSLQAVRTILFQRETAGIEALMKRVKPDVVVVSQGRIEGGSAGLLAAKRAGLRTISYIPMAHSVSISGKPIAANLRDALNRYFYRLPDKYITISKGARDMLRARGVTSEIAVVPNGIEGITLEEGDRRRFREARGIRRNEFVVGVVGRIDFRQKCQDFALQAIARFQGALGNWKFLFIGDGPDAGRLRRMIGDLKLEEFAVVLPWIPNPAEVYAGLNMLLIPSRFEGVPLVMLEAMSCRLPIVASDVDGMAENLPKSWLFPYRNSEAMIEKLVSVRAADASKLLEENCRQVASENTFAQFGLRFANAVLG
jgi:glycosyltransferase involved in cell wall biosynthesis